MSSIVDEMQLHYFCDIELVSNYKNVIFYAFTIESLDLVCHHFFEHYNVMKLIVVLKLRLKIGHVFSMNEDWVNFILSTEQSLV